MAAPIDMATALRLRDVLPKAGETQPGGGAAPTGGASFVDSLKDAVETTLSRDAASREAAATFSKGSELDLHETLMSMEKGDVSLKFMVSVRNKVLDAYREIMRMGG